MKRIAEDKWSDLSDYDQCRLALLHVYSEPQTSTVELEIKPMYGPDEWLPAHMVTVEYADG